MNRHLAITLGLAVIATAACNGYERTNPLDPQYPLKLTIIGPDTIVSVNDTIAFEVITEPSHPNLNFAWSSSNTQLLAPVPQAPGTFASLRNGTVTLRVAYGTHEAQKEVVVKQRPVKMIILPPPTTDLASLGEEVFLTAAVVDERNTPVEGSAAAFVWTSSDTTVARVENGRVTARKNGTAWIKAEALEQADSIFFRIQQVPVSLSFGSDVYTIPIPGGSVQTQIFVRDARGVQLENTSGLTVTSSRSSFQVNSSGLVQSSGFGSTTITARLGDLTASTLVRVVGGTAPRVLGVAAGLTALEAPGSSPDFLLIELDTRDAEFDLDAATVEIYSVDETFMTIRIVPLEQGVATYSTLLAIPSMAGAGEVRVRLVDAAQNGSGQTFWGVGTYQPLRAPDLTVQEVRTIGDSIDVRAVMERGDDNLRNLHLIGLTTTGQTIVQRSKEVASPDADTSEMSIGARLPAGTELSFLGVAVSDTAGRFSVIRRVQLPQSGIQADGVWDPGGASNDRVDASAGSTLNLSGKP